jgi:hypothetical protein
LDVLSDFRVCDWFGDNRLLQQPIKQQASGGGSPSVKPEDELIEVVVQLSWLYGALVRSKKPALKKCSNPVNAWHRLMSWRLGSEVHRSAVLVSQFIKISVGW